MVSRRELRHTEKMIASGIAGIMKTVLALEHGVVPPIRGLKKLNPNSEFSESFCCPKRATDMRFQSISKTGN